MTQNEYKKYSQIIPKIGELFRAIQMDFEKYLFSYLGSAHIGKIIQKGSEI